MLCRVYQLGVTGYSEVYSQQLSLLSYRINGEIVDSLLILEHPPTITIGKSGSRDNVLATQKQLLEMGIVILATDRGGDVTYHGPGQLVAYPIIDLKSQRRDLRQYLHNLEEVIIRTLDDFDIRATRDSNHPGVWVKDKEIAALGLRVKRWVSMHGIALNVNTDLAPFSLIKPCGFTDRGATSMASLLGCTVPIAVVTEKFLAHFAELFDAQLEWGSVLPTESHY
ncbi:MAG: lipoyl(octanoyl) transferase LipB [Dehalococcoidales bacterium]|nr:lipoyl(octanoyl) transferase LipB [Dehalococcoidales bacterium]